MEKFKTFNKNLAVNYDTVARGALKDLTSQKSNLLMFALKENSARKIYQDLTVAFNDDQAAAIAVLYQKDPELLVKIIQNGINVKKQKEESKKHDPSKPYAGQILVESGGYNCILVSFYQVVKVTKCFVWVKPIKAETVQDVDGYGQQTYKRPIKDSFESNKALRRKIHPYNGKWCILPYYHIAKPWDGQDAYEDTLD